jgi:hypothetical protein
MTFRDGERETVTMDHELICTWLGLPSKSWPPDHYTLLGLAPGEGDMARIEQHVHERLARLRCYQISHPGPATEAMNRLAQAFLCLTDPEARKAYNAQFFPHLLVPAPAPVPPAPAPQAQPQAPTPAPAVATLTPPPMTAPPVRPITPGVDTGVVYPAQTQVDWRNATPPPVRAPVLPIQIVVPPPANGMPPVSVVAPAPPAPANGDVPAPVPAADSTPAAPAPPTPPAAPAPAPAPVSRPVDPVFETARSPEARRGLSTRRRLYQRVLLTRRLLRTWDRLGKYVAKPKRKLARTAEENELTRLLERADGLLEQFPALIGQPGQPGYRVLSLAHDDAPVTMFNRQGATERDALARDWLAGQALLQAHRQFLRQQVKRLRRQGVLTRLLYSLQSAVNDHPVWVAVVVSLVTLGVLAIVVLR